MKKRKQATAVGNEQKRARLESSDDNVELTKMLRSNVPMSSKLKAAFEYVELQKQGSSPKRIALPMRHFTAFLADWLQSTISSQKEVNNACIDIRSWTILQWCLTSQTGTYVTPGVLRGIEAGLKKAAELPEAQSVGLLEVLVNTLEVLVQERSFRPQLLDWISVVSASARSVLQRTGSAKLDKLLSRAFVLLNTSFTGFLSTSSNPKAAFQATVEKLLEPMLSLMGPAVDYGVDIVQSVEAVLENGLFHAAYVESFPNVCTVFSNKTEDASSHKLLFEKLKKLRLTGNISALGHLFRLFVRRFRLHRACVNDDIFGVRGSSQKQEEEDPEPEAEETKAKHLTDGQKMFAVFAEITTPLISELAEKSSLSVSDIQQSKELLTAVNSLFQALKDEQVYIPTRDTPSGEHFQFITQYYDAVVHFADLISSSSSSLKSAREEVAEGFLEVISGIGLVLDLDHRTTEEAPGALWRILISAAAIQRGDKEEIVSCSCKLLNIWSELRSISSIIRLAFASIKLPLHSQNGWLSGDSYEAAITAIFCEPEVLKVVGKTMETLTDAQAGEVVNMILEDASETLSIVNKHRSGGVAEVVVKVLSELYAQMLTTINITSTNALKVGNSVRQYVESVLREPLNELLDELEHRNGTGDMVLKGFFHLRLYLQLQSLHRQCVTLMPPLKAVNARASAHEVSVDAPEFDWAQVALEPADLGFFAWTGRPQVTVANVLDSLRLLLVENKTGSSGPALYHVLDHLITHRLSELQRFIQSSEYHEAEASFYSSEDFGEETKGSDSSVLHKNFTDEAKTLTSRLLDPIEQMEMCHASWNEVVSSLSEQSLPSATWQLVSRTVDIWSKYATKGGLRRLVARVLDDYSKHSDSAQLNTSCELLGNVSFFEDVRIQSALVPALFRTLSKNLQLKLNFRDDFNLNMQSSNMPENPPLTSIQKSANLIYASGFFPWRHMSEEDTMKYAGCICYIERFLLERMKNRHKVAYLELFSACRRTLQSLKISDHHQEILGWLHESTEAASQCLAEGEQVDDAFKMQKLYYSAMKSTQAFVDFNMREAFLEGSKHLLVGCALNCEEAEYVRSVLKFSVQRLKTQNQQPSTFKLLASVSLARTLLWSITSAVDRLDQKCQEDKGRQSKWLPQLPDSWVWFLRKAELLLVPRLFQQLASSVDLAATSSIVDIFLDKCEYQIDGNALMEVETETDLDSRKIEDNEDTLEVDEDEDHEDEEDVLDATTNGDEDTTTRRNGEKQVGSSRALKALLDSETRDEREIVGELLMAVGALVKLRSLYFSPYAAKAPAEPTTPSSVLPLLEVLYVLLKEATRILPTRVSELSWLLGAVKCMESMGLLLPSVKPGVDASYFSKLVLLHIELLAATSNISSASQLGVQRIVPGVNLDIEHFHRELRTAVKNSFGALLRYAPGQHLLISFQTLKSSISASQNAAVVSSGVECLAVSLDSVTGPWRLKLLAKYSPRFVASLVILISNMQDEQPIVLQCLEILNRLASRDVVFPIKPSHVSLLLHIPAALFRPLCHSGSRKDNVDGHFMVQLYTASCKLIYAVLKHRKRESGRCIALLTESLRVLLYCLEAASESKTSSWNMSRAVQCAQWLRRVHEQIGEQKETLSRYCNHIISDYLAVLSGTSPIGSGLSRELDRELRPGVYALIEACSTLDLQQLYAALEDGPLKNNLNMVRHDYEKNFKYTGKV